MHTREFVWENETNTILLDFEMKTDHFIQTRKLDLLEVLEDLKIREEGEIIETTVFIRLARILRRVRETWENLLSLRPMGNIVS